MTKPCFQRDNMPQIDLKHYPDLFTWLNKRDVLVTRQEVKPSWLTIRQCLNECHPARRNALLTKELLVAMDLDVLDGNNRLLRHMLDGTQLIPVYVLNRNFKEARALLLEYPKSYTYAIHPHMKDQF